MELGYFKDKVFELLNDADNMEISDIEVNDTENTFTVFIGGESVFKVECSRAT